MNLPGILMLIILFVCGFGVVCVAERRRLRLAGLGVVIIVLVIAGYYLWQLHRFERGFGQLHVGDSRERVRQIMGAPTEDTDSTVGIYGSKQNASEHVQGCTEQYWYYPFLTPECWWISFDAKGQVLGTLHYVSP